MCNFYPKFKLPHDRPLNTKTQEIQCETNHWVIKQDQRPKARQTANKCISMKILKWQVADVNKSYSFKGSLKPFHAFQPKVVTRLEVTLKEKASYGLWR